MRRMTSCAITGVACVSITIAASSPTTTPVLGSPSAVYAYAWSESLSKLIFFSTRSACDANFFSVMGIQERYLLTANVNRSVVDKTVDTPATAVGLYCGRTSANRAAGPDVERERRCNCAARHADAGGEVDSPVALALPCPHSSSSELLARRSGRAS